MYPKADVPVLQMSLPTMNAPTLFALGRALAPLRDEGVLVVGSGFLTHNLRRDDARPGASRRHGRRNSTRGPRTCSSRRDVDELVDYRYVARPACARRCPTHEHFVPVVVAMGAASTRRARSRSRSRASAAG